MKYIRAGPNKTSKQNIWGKSYMRYKIHYFRKYVTKINPITSSENKL